MAAVPETHDTPGAAEEILRALGGAAGRLIWARPLPFVAAIVALVIWVVSGRVWGLLVGLVVAAVGYACPWRCVPGLFVWQARRARRLAFSRAWPVRAEALGLVGGRVGGERPIPRLIDYAEGGDGSSRITVVLPAGLTPVDFANRAEHLAHELGVFRVAVDSMARGRVTLTLFRDDPLGSTARPETAPAIPPIRLGMAETQGAWSWDPARCPHVLVCGETGSGKSTFLRAVLRGWPGDVRLSDPKLLEFGAWAPGGRLLSAVHRLGDIDAMLAGVTLTVRERAVMLAGQGATHWTEASAAGLRPLLVILDEWPATMTLTEEGESAKDAKARQDRLAASLDAVANLGRAVGVHLVLGAQRPDASLFRSGATREQFTGKVALGWLTPEGAGMMFGDRTAVELMSGEAGTGAAAGFSAPVPERVRVDYVSAAEAHAAYRPGEPPLSGVGA